MLWLPSVEKGDCIPMLYYEDWTEAIHDFFDERCVIERKCFTQYTRLYVEFILWMKGKIITMRLPSDVTFNRAVKQEFEDNFNYSSIKEGICYHYGRRINGYDGIAIIDDEPFDTSSALYGMRLSAMQDERMRQDTAIRMRGKKIPIMSRRSEGERSKPQKYHRMPSPEEVLPGFEGYDPATDSRGPLPLKKPWETGQYSGMGQPGFIEPEINDELKAYIESQKSLEKQNNVEIVEDDGFADEEDDKLAASFEDDDDNG